MRQIAGRVRFLDLLPITCEDVYNEVRKGLKLVGHYLLARSRTSANLSYLQRHLHIPSLSYRLNRRLTPFAGSTLVT